MPYAAAYALLILILSADAGAMPEHTRRHAAASAIVVAGASRRS